MEVSGNWRANFDHKILKGEHNLSEFMIPNFVFYLYSQNLPVNFYRDKNQCNLSSG